MFSERGSKREREKKKKGGQGMQEGERGRKNKQEGKESWKEICKLGVFPPPRPFRFSVKTFVNSSLALAHSQWQVLLAT